MGRGRVCAPVFWMYLPAQHGEGMGYTHISEMTADSRNNLQQAWLNTALANWRWNHLRKTVLFSFFKSLHFLLMTWSWKCLFESLSNLVKESAQILLSRTVGYKMMIEQQKGQLQGLTTWQQGCLLGNVNGDPWGRQWCWLYTSLSPVCHYWGATKINS